MKNDIEVLYLRMIAALEAEKARSLKSLKLTPVLMDDGPVEEVRVKRIVIDSAPPLDMPDRPPQTAATATESNVTEIWAGQPPAPPVAESPTPETADADTAPVIAYVPADAQPASDAEPPKPRPFRVSVASFVLRCRKRLQDMYKRRDYVRGLDRAQRIINREYKRIVGQDAEFAAFLQEQEASQTDDQTPRREPIRRD